MRSVITAILCAVVLVSARASAQEGETSDLQGGLVNLHGVLTFPKDAFGEKLDRVGAGVGLDLGYAPPWLPVAAGLTGNLSWYSMTTKDVFVTTDRYSGWMPLGVSGKLLTLYLFARLQPHTGDFRPFVEGLGGLNILWMGSSVEDESFEERGFHGDNILTDTGLGYGAGAGVEYRIARESGESGKPVETYVSLRVRYLYGSKMEYLHAESVSFDNSGKPFVRSEDRMRSEIEMMQIMLGITVRM